MSQPTKETVVVRDREGVWQLRVEDDWTTMTLLGALSADPRSFDELSRAWLRYRPCEPLEDLPWIEGVEAPAAGPWCLLDLACLRVVAGGGAELPDDGTAFQRDDGPWTAENPVVWINFPPAWQCDRAANWETALRPLPVPEEPLDVRGILFGRPLAEAIAQRTIQIARRESLPATRLSERNLERNQSLTDAQREAQSRWHALTIQVHAAWLLTPREDLGNEPPRTFLHRGRDWVEHEVENRSRQWSNEGRAPRPLDRDTFAYRFGPLGRHEVVMYFDLCRIVIDAAWDQLLKRPEIDDAELTNTLHQHAQAWLAEGSIDGDPMPPAVIIENERRRMPLVDDGSHLDCDCPLCRMGAEGEFGVMFTGFDGYHLEMDDEFAFSLCETRDEWEEQQGDFSEFSEKIDAQQEREVEDAEPLGSVWSSSYVNEKAVSNESAASVLSVMALAVRVAELVGDLKTADADRQLIEGLNDAFDAYRAADEDPTLLVAVTTTLVDVLEQIADAYPELTGKSADLQSQFDERQRRL